MASVGVNLIETAALGRPFKLGMLYDCRKEALIAGVRLWSKEQLQQNISSCAQVNTGFNVTASDSIQDKSELLNIDGGLKLSVLGDLIHVSGAAKYLKDTKTSFIQQRLTLHYHSTSKFEELTVNHLPSENIPYNDSDIATHVVTAILYGTDACFVFDREVSSDEDKSTVTGEVKMAFEKLQGVVSVGANADLNVDHSLQTAVKKFTCTFYGDFQLPSNPTSFEDALTVFADFPKLLKEDQELAVPLRVWLYPLDKLLSRPTKLHKDISIDLIMEIESVMESLNTTEMKCSDLLKDSPALMFAAFHDKILHMKQNCYKYKLRLMKTLGSLLPNIRGDVMEETTLKDLLQEHDASPFRGYNLAEWIKERERESKIIKTVLRQLKDVEFEEEDLILMNLEVGNVVSYTFTSLNSSGGLLKKTAYISPSTQGETDEKNPVSELKSWLTPEIKNTMRSNLRIFKNLFNSKECKPVKFIMSSKEMENHPGSCILLYENGCEKAVCFTPPSQPACPITEEVKGQSVILKVPPSCPATVELRLLYKPKQDTVWRSEPVLKDQYEFTLSDLREETEYEIKCAALGKLNYTVESDVLRVITESENKDIGTVGVKGERIEHLFYRLHLEDRCHNKLRNADVLRITAHSLQSHESCAEEELIQTFIQKLMMMDYNARYIHVEKAIGQGQTKTRNNDSSADKGDVFKAMSVSKIGTSHYERIHPMDVQMAVFHCADGFLKQLMVTKLSQCQYALPLLVPDPFTQQIEFPLWTFRQINKSWKMRNTNNEIISQTQPIYKAETPMVSFFRFGSVSSSKSQLMNNLINEKHNTFFHRNCPGSSKTRELMDGVVEIAWFCPSGKNTDKFSECVAFCNLHGDAGDHEKQLHILTDMASVNVVLLPQLQKNYKNLPQVQDHYKGSKPLICLFTEDESMVIETKKRKFKIGLKDRNQSDVSEELRRAIKDCLSESSHSFRLEDVSKYSEIRVDEEDDDDCMRGREAAQQMMSLLEKKDLTEIKESFLPHQGKLWHQWSQKNKELHRPQGDESEIAMSIKRTVMKKIRVQQYESDSSEFMKLFIKEMNSNDEHEEVFFIKWLTILLDEYISANLSAVHDGYNKRSRDIKLKEKHGNYEQLKTNQIELKRISEEFQAAPFGLQHIMREIGQIYESCSSVKKNKKDLQFHFSSLPSLAAEMMISGFPLELMDGDAAHVPVIWISALLDKLTQKLGDQRVFVLSVLGTQSSGKSTMLNAMFGLQFPVGAGRCTRGAFMQLVKVSDEMKTQMNFDYILVVDTEGLCALKLAGRSTRHNDNELATFVVGLANLTLINIFGENPSEMQDILQIVVQAFMRMKKVKLNPRCVFVHQNVSDVTAGEKNMEGRRQLQEKLDEMTKLAAKEEVCDAECFSDFIRFDVQNDVKYFAQFWEGNPPMAPPNPNYCANIQELKQTIMSHASMSHGMMLIDLKDRIKDIWEALLNERFVFTFRNSLEISAYRKLETEYSKWSWRLFSAMMEIENKLHNKIENETIHEVEETDLQTELKKTSEEVERSMSDFFEKATDADILIQWKTSFEVKMKDIQKNIVRETKRKLNEILQQRDLKKKIDAQRIHYENHLFEKSKELALDFKANLCDEKALKKEFDLFWELNVKKIIGDTHTIRNIDILRDVREILSDIYEYAPVDHGMESNDIFTLSSYSEYVLFKRFTRRGIKVASQTVKETRRFAHVFFPEDEDQIRSFVTDVVLQTDKMIQSFNISKMGYNISNIQQLIDYIKKRVTEHQEGPEKYVFKIEFFVNLVIFICKRANKMITEQHTLFREVNDPEIFVKKKKQVYYSIFQKYCHGAASAAIFGKIICQKLKDPIEQSVYKKTARDLTGEMRSNFESLNGNRSNLEKHIQKTLAEEEDFDKYIHNPRDHFKSFIRHEVSRYITRKFRFSVLHKMKDNIKVLQQKIMEAVHESTEHVQVNRGDVGLWLKSFTQKLSDVLIFSEKDLSGVKHEVEDFNTLECVIRKELCYIVFIIRSSFSQNTFPVKLDHKFRPDELLIDHFCQCCWVQCPFRKAICTNTIENHDGDHSFHPENEWN